MKKYCLACVLIILCIDIIQAQNTYQKIYGHGYGEDFVYDNKKDFTVLGTALDTVSFMSDFYLIKTDSNGIMLWNKTYGGLNHESGYRIQQSNDNGYILAGITKSFGAGNNDFLLIKVDSLGNVNWSKAYGGTGDENYSTGLLLLPNDECIVCGMSKSFGSGDIGVCLIKTDSNGVNLWSRLYDISGVDDVANDIKQTQDNGFIITGWTSTDLFLLKLDSIGAIQWLKSYTKPSSNDRGMKVKALDDGGFIVVGESDGNYIHIMRTDSLGSIVWSKTYSGLNSVQDITLTSDFGYILTGVYPVFLPGGNVDVFLIKTDSLGNFEWGTLYGDSWSDVGRKVLQIDNEYVIAGTRVVNSTLGNLGHVYLIKTDSTGNTGNCFGTISVSTFSGLFETAAPTLSSSLISVTTNNAIISVDSVQTETTLCFLLGVEESDVNSQKKLVSPNPTSGQFNFLKLDNNSTIRIYDCIGKLVLQTILKDSEQTIDISNKEKGIYFYRIENQIGEFSSGKFILQ